MKGLATLTHRARYGAVTFVSTKPALYYGIRRASGRLDELCVTPQTDIVIEGFPRSANSTTVQRFKDWQDRPLAIAHHKHHAAQIVRGTELGLPTLALIRPPKAACLSLLALAAEARHRAGREQDKALCFTDVFNAYSAFYEAIEPCLDRLVIGRFDRVRTDLPGIIRDLNQRFGCSFGWEDTSGPRKTAPLGWHALPNHVRNGIKADLDARFETALQRSAALRRSLRRAEAVHQRIEEADGHLG